MSTTIDLLVSILAGAVGGGLTARFTVRRTTTIEARAHEERAVSQVRGYAGEIDGPVHGAIVTNTGSGDAAGRDIHK